MISSTLLQKHNSQVQEKSRHVLNNRSYELRNSVRKKNFCELSDGYNNVETMCKLLCKPISINITRLSVSELNVMCKSKSYSDQLQASLIQEKNKHIVRTNIRNDVKSKKLRKSKSGCNSAMQNVAFFKAKECGIKKIHIQGLTKGIKQPYIKLHRIDEVVNKVAQTSVKIIRNAKCERCVESEYVEDSEVKLNEAASEELESSTLNGNKFDIQCIKDYQSQSVTANSHINKILQSTKYTQNQTKSTDNSETHISCKRKQMSSDSISHCNHVNGNSKAQNLIIQGTKKLKLNSSEGVKDIYIPNKVHSGIESKCVDESQTVLIESCQKLNPSANMIQENAFEFKDIFLESENDDAVNSSKEKGNLTIHMVRESNSIYIEQDKTESKEIQNPMHQSIPFDKHIVEKYKILKELRVLLVPVDSFFMFHKQAKQQRKENIQVPSTCHNLPGHSKDSKGVSEKNSKQNVIRDLKHKLVVSPSITEFTLKTITQQYPHKSSELLYTAKNTVGTKQPEGVLNTSFKNICCSKKRTSKSLLSKANSMEHLNSQVPEKLNSSAYMKSININNTKDTGYKCIICDLYFMDYSNLQQHLTIHTWKHGKNLLQLSKSSLSFFEELQCTRFNLPRSKPSECTHSKLKINESSGIAKGCLNKVKIGEDIKSDRFVDSNKCSIIYSSMLSRSCDFAMSESLRVSQLGEQNLSILEEGKKNKESPELRTVDQNSIINSISYVPEKSPKVVRNEKELFGQHSKNRIIESPALSKNASHVQFLSNIKSKIQKFTKTANIGITFTVCNCHNRVRTNKNCVQIEIILLCRTCKVLFRTMECFEAHYRFAEYITCNANRLSARSPKLFCRGCGMIFSSIQDVRHHLEIHAQFNKNYTMEFSCNVCKVLFIGIGSLFYTHWTTHTQDPLWIANEQSFPKNSMRISKSTNINKCNKGTARISNIFVEGYLQVAEHVCQNCQLPFVTHNDLKQHVTFCNMQYLGKAAIVSEKSNLTVQTHLSPQYVVKQVDEFLPVQAQTMSSKNEVHSATCNLDKENLIRILEGNGDSELELQIDLTESFEECDQISERDDIEQIRQAIKGLSDADTWIPTVVENFKSSDTIMVNESETNINGIMCTQDVKDKEISRHAMETVVVPICPQNLATPTSAQDRSLNTQINADVSQVSCQNIVKKGNLEQLTVQNVENIQSHAVNDAAFVKNENELSALTVVTPAGQPSPQQARIGYLRVKPLAELVGHRQMHEDYSTPTVSGPGHESSRQNAASEQFANCMPETSNAEESSLIFKEKLVPLTKFIKPSLSVSNTSTQHQCLVNGQIEESSIAISRKKLHQLRPKINQNTHLHATQNNVILKQYQPTIIKQPNTITQNSCDIYQYPYAVATNSNKSKKMFRQIKPIGNFPVAVNTSVPNYYNNISLHSGGISVIINQTASSVQNAPTVNMSQLPANQQIFQAPVLNAPLPFMNTPNPMQSQMYWMWPST